MQQPRPADRGLARSTVPGGATAPDRDSLRTTDRPGSGSRAPRNARGPDAYRPVRGDSSSQPSSPDRPSRRQPVTASWPAASATMRQPPGVLRRSKRDSMVPEASGGSLPRTIAQYVLRARPAANSACAAIKAARLSAITRQPDVSASSRCTSHGPSRRRERRGNQSSTLGPPRGPGCTGSPGGLSRTTNRSSRNRRTGSANV